VKLASKWYQFTRFYDINKWTLPLPGSKLMVFDDLESARCFSNIEDAVFECKVKNPSKKWAGFQYVMRTKDIPTMLKANKLRLQKKKFTHLLPNDQQFTPFHTVFVDAVKLTKIIND